MTVSTSAAYNRRMKRVIPLLSSAVLLSACASGHSTLWSTAACIRACRRSPDSGNTCATLKAQSLLRRFPLPTGARPTRVPSSRRTSNARRIGPRSVRVCPLARCSSPSRFPRSQGSSRQIQYRASRTTRSRSTRLASTASPPRLADTAHVQRLVRSRQTWRPSSRKKPLQSGSIRVRRRKWCRRSARSTSVVAESRAESPKRRKLPDR